MKLNSLQLKNFRSYSQKSFQFSKNTTLFIGPNAIGKTNILEAIAIIALGKSFRAQKDEEMIQFGQDFSRISADNDGESLEVVLTHGLWQGKKVAKKRYLINGTGRKRKDFVAKLKVVLFQPQDIDLIIGSPSKKRDYLNYVLSQVDIEYDQSLTAYEKGLRQRNKLLHLISDSKATQVQLEFWNRLLIKNGEIIRKKREEYLEFLSQNSHLSKYIDSTNSNNLPSFYYQYDPSVITQKRLESHQQAEIASKTTLIGPHRDKFHIFQYKENPENKKDISLYASRGEQRIAIITTKLTELEYFSQKTGENPLLLLDDIFSELDENYQNLIINVIGRQQTIITTTDINNIHLKNPQLLEVINLGNN
jgi:DNA replication and repair protein RecF